ncbi:HAMP domain-containing histidine kinase [Caldibacillus lycopersici]|uniref:histidine kinase n=1 Tax=Perspicuibacillus lycopersici TaxID=1325689 RepID=A0AAE3LNN2_9BACI|nr:HAMP domain-containing sensor histidine kinase [Perspicuibacillus lycopersici]MCU9614905.1 HAMP domain-containing histidine kinase [Perspicuibacillus lycopersici]
MWGWIFVFLAVALLLYLFFLKRELRKLKLAIRTVPERAGFGSRLSLDFREKALLELVDELNVMIDSFEEKNRKAKQMEENVKLSIAGLSHDLRTPLTSINGYVQLLHGTSDDAKREHYLAIMEQSVQRLIEMTEQFYDIARIETNQKEIVLSSLSIATIVEEIFLSFYEQLEEEKIVVQFPDLQTDRKIIADQLMLTRVIQNIVQNILRYANSKVFIHYRIEHNFLVLLVKNDMKRDSKVAIEKVFTRFYTEVSSRTNTEASGLGLYLSKKLIEKMNGKMDAELQDNWFILKVYLPVSRR